MLTTGSSEHSLLNDITINIIYFSLQMDIWLYDMIEEHSRKYEIDLFNCVDKAWSAIQIM